MRLFFTAFIQVFLVSANTYFISQMFLLGIAIAGFGISYFWTVNVRKISVGTLADRLRYSIGAMFGGLFGVLTATMILPVIQPLIDKII